MASVSWVLCCLPCNVRASSSPHRLFKDFSMWSLQQGYPDLLDDGLRFPRTCGPHRPCGTSATLYWLKQLTEAGQNQEKEMTQMCGYQEVWFIVSQKFNMFHHSRLLLRLLLNPYTHPSLPKVCLPYSSGSFSWVSPIFLGTPLQFLFFFPSRNFIVPPKALAPQAHFSASSFILEKIVH